MKERLRRECTEVRITGDVQWSNELLDVATRSSFCLLPES